MKTAKRKLAKVTSEIEQLEKNIAESQKKLSDLKREKLEAENSEIISLVRNADLSVDDIAELISELTTVKKNAVNMETSTVSDNTDTVENQMLKGNVG